jgi:hypothetical protein
MNVEIGTEAAIPFLGTHKFKFLCSELYVPLKQTSFIFVSCGQIFKKLEWKHVYSCLFYQPDVATVSLYHINFFSLRLLSAYTVRIMTEIKCV